jgi:MFS transporter, OPA family, glycerol-3-phosphate transporter
MLVGSLIAYGLFYFTRKNISVALPLLSRDLGYTNAELGVLGALLYVSYGTAKALFGIFADRADARRLLAWGLALSALVSLVFPLATSLAVFGALWFLNGIFQAAGAPACAKICVRWFSVSERGTKWSIWNTSHMIGGGVVLVVAGFFASWFGWRGVFIGPALICLLGVVFIWVTLRDRPEACGLPPIEVYRSDPEAGEGEPEVGTSHLQQVVRNVLLNRSLVILALASMCVYVVRYGALDWSTKYLVEAKGQPVHWAGSLSSLLEFVGIPGCLAAGWISDRYFRARRAPISFIFLIALAASVGLFWLVPPGHPWLDAAALAAIGFFTYGPQTLLAGVAAADFCGARMAAAAVGVTGAFSYAGAIVASTGTGYLVDRYGWAGGFALWFGAALLAALLVVPLWSARGRQR